MSAPKESHKQRMYRTMEYVHSTKSLGNFLAPTGVWNGPEDKVLIAIITDSELSSDPDNRNSVLGITVTVNGAPVKCVSKMHKTTVLSITEGELIAGVEGVQDALFIKQMYESIGVQVALPMIWTTDNKGAKDLVDTWSTSGRTRHIATRINFMRELKEDGILQANWVAGSEMPSDMYTKNLGGAAFTKHRATYVG